MTCLCSIYKVLPAAVRLMVVVRIAYVAIGCWKELEMPTRKSDCSGNLPVGRLNLEFPYDVVGIFCSPQSLWWVFCNYGCTFSGKLSLQNSELIRVMKILYLNHTFERTVFDYVAKYDELLWWTSLMDQEFLCDKLLCVGLIFQVYNDPRATSYDSNVARRFWKKVGDCMSD